MSNFEQFTVHELLTVAGTHYRFSRAEKRNKQRLVAALNGLSVAVQQQIASLLVAQTHPAPVMQDHLNALDVDAAMDNETMDPNLSPSPTIYSEENHFMVPCGPEEAHERLARFIDRTGNTALAMTVCLCCAREVNQHRARYTLATDIPNQVHLRPTKAHPMHILTDGMLLHTTDNQPTASGWICHECERSLLADAKPPYSLANGMWVGHVPWELAVLTLPERILIAKYYPAAYIVKLSPKKKGARHWDPKGKNSGLKGNVSTYRLNLQDIAGIVSEGSLPPPPSILAATIGITFVGPKGLPETTLPDFLRVRKSRVLNALKWCCKNNHLYGDITISQANIDLLPEDGIPEELTAITKVSEDVAALAAEHETYVPDDDGQLQHLSCGY